MSKVMFKYGDGLEITKDDLMETILNGFVRSFGFKPPKSIVKIKFCYPTIHKCSDGFIDEGYICEFLIRPGDGRLIRYHYNSIYYTLERV